MPVLEQKTKKVKLPTIKGSEVHVAEYVTWGDVSKAGISDGNLAENGGIKVLAGLIKDWNFTDKDGNKLEINQDNIGKLSVADIEHIIKEVGLKKGA